MQPGYFREETIAAIATAAGGAISVLRCSGPRSLEFLRKISGSEFLDEKKYPHSRMTRTPLFLSDGKPLDDALVSVFYAPKSFTGETVVEYHCHGGAFVSQRVLETLLHHGALQALPGEFSFRGVRNGKFSVFQAQAISDLIASQNDQALMLAVEKLSGHHDAYLSTLAKDLKQLAALGEIGIDFSDQDIDEVSLPRLKERALGISDSLERLSHTFQQGRRIQSGLQIALIGLPNAGKSSFFNALLGEDRSIVSDIPGTTRDVVGEQITLRSQDQMVTVRFEDTAGLRKSQDQIEVLGMKRTQTAIQNSDLTIFVLDASAEMKPAIQEWKKMIDQSSLRVREKTLGILSKTDLLSESEVSKIALLAEKEFGINQWLATSAPRKQGIHEAIEAIIQKAIPLLETSQQDLVLTRAEHAKACQAGVENLQRALNASEIDLFASDVRHALYALSPLLGEVATDDILHQIFSDFCIGK